VPVPPPIRGSALVVLGYVVSSGIWSLWMDPCSDALLPSAESIVEGLLALQSGTSFVEKPFVH
jgi:hypothetical protein